MYEVGDFEFERESSASKYDYCRSCGTEVEVSEFEWAAPAGAQGRATRCIRVVEEGGGSFISVSGEPYPVCNECLTTLQGMDPEQVMIRLLHPELQESLPAFLEVDVDNRAEIKRAGRIGALIDLACEDC